MIALCRRVLLPARLLPSPRIRDPYPLCAFGLWIDRHPHLLVHGHDQEQEEGREEERLSKSDSIQQQQTTSRSSRGSGARSIVHIQQIIPILFSTVSFSPMVS